MNDVLNIRYVLNESSDVNIEISDVTGKVVYAMAAGSQSRGEHELVIQRAVIDLPGGMYLMKLISGDGSISKKIVLE